MEDGHKAAQDLMTRHPDTVGIYAGNDEEAQGAIAVLRASVCSPAWTSSSRRRAMAIRKRRKRSKRDCLLCTAANVPQYMGAMMATRIYDVMNGWRPRAAERMMLWGSRMMTTENVDGYLERYVNNGDVAPFNYGKCRR